MKRYIPRTWQIYKDRSSRTPGMRVSITHIDKEDLIEAVVRPDAYFKVLRNIFRKIENEFDQFRNSKQACQYLTDVFTPFKIIFEYENKVNDASGINGGGTDSDLFNTIYIFCNDFILRKLQTKYNEVISEVILILGHEFIHRNQAIRMRSEQIIKDKFVDKESARAYYGDRQETMTHAWHIVEILRRKGLTNKKIRQLLRAGNMTEEHYLQYIELFDIDSKVVKRLIKYMYEYTE